MKTSYGILGYCSNIHPGEKWEEHFQELKDKLPKIKANVSPNQPFGFGLRIANEASLMLESEEKLNELKAWLEKEDLYIFTLNGFPYGGFHHVEVKDQVHHPDWRTSDRLEYTKRLIKQLAYLLPNNLKEAGISTSPLSYKPWFENPIDLLAATIESTNKLVDAALFAKKIFQETGKKIHLDIEPEPDGILGDHQDFVDWYENILMVHGKNYLSSQGYEKDRIEDLLNDYIRICFDVCHYGVSFDSPKDSLKELKEKGIKMGKYQISSAVKMEFKGNTEEELRALEEYIDPVYLHQVKAKLPDGSFRSYLDLPEALNQVRPEELPGAEWRIHFHVPIFLTKYDSISSTQVEILETLKYIQTDDPEAIMEIETYTWGVLPKNLQTTIVNSISREINWVKECLSNE